MREIEFRGKRIDTGEWVYGDLLKTKDSVKSAGSNELYSNCFITARSEMDILFVNGGSSNSLKIISFLVDPETVSQYIGIKDKNGVKIFEGDMVIVSHEDLLSGYQERTGAVVIEPLGVMIDFGEQQTSAFAFYNDDPEDFEVVGNIHEDGNG